MSQAIKCFLRNSLGYHCDFGQLYQGLVLGNLGNMPSGVGFQELRCTDEYWSNLPVPFDVIVGMKLCSFYFLI